MNRHDTGIDTSTAATVTASVVSHGQGELLAQLIDDLCRVRAPSLAHLIVTLNVAEPPPDAARAPFRVTLLANPQPLGFGANHNRAFRHCETPWFCVLNPDLRISDDFLAPMLAAAAPQDAVLAPRVLEADGAVADSARELPTPWRLLRRALGDRRAAADDRIDWLAGMCLLIRADAFRALRGFDERYYMYCEDIDLCLRAQLAGGRLRRIGAAAVVHAAQRASHRSWRHLRWHTHSLLRLWFGATLRAYRKAAKSPSPRRR
jgi:GT2 family glycosyltransferase